MEYKTLPTEKLQEWEVNKRLRAITEDNYYKLKEKLQLKPQFKPLIVTPDGDQFIVLAGNHRLKVYKELGIKNLWVEIVEFHQDEHGLWHGYIDGQQTPEAFETRDDAMLDWSMADNEEVAYYDREAFVNEMDQYHLNWENINLSFDSPLSVPASLHKYDIDVNAKDNEENTDAKGTLYQVVVDCRNDAEQQEYFEKLETLGIPAKKVTR